MTAYILIQTEVGMAGQVAKALSQIEGILSAEGVAGPYDVIAKVDAPTVDQLGQLVVAQVQAIEGITRTLTCSVVRL